MNVADTAVVGAGEAGAEKVSGVTAVANEKPVSGVGSTGMVQTSWLPVIAQPSAKILVEEVQGAYHQPQYVSILLSAQLAC